MNLPPYPIVYYFNYITKTKINQGIFGVYGIINRFYPIFSYFLIHLYPVQKAQKAKIQNG